MTDTGTRDSNLHRAFVSYLSRTGWSTASTGAAGELWENETLRSAVIAVPFSANRWRTEVQAALDRLANAERREVTEVLGDIEEEFFDVQSYRISDRYVYDDAAMLSSVGAVLTSAQSLLRVAATTTRKLQAQIGSNYSKPGDEIAKRARLSHTRRGSFVLPVVMPVDPPEPTGDQLDGQAVTIESAERAVTRTLGYAVQALQTVVVRAGKEPNADGITHLVESGVSREMVAAVRAVATAPGVNTFETTFRWSPALGAPFNAPERVVIPDDAAPLLGKVEQKLKRTKSEEDSSISGHIVQIRWVPDEPFGSIAVRTERRGRPADVLVHVKESVIHDAYTWAHDHRAVLVRGRIEGVPGRPLEIAKPSRIVPIDLLFTELGQELAPPA